MCMQVRAHAVTRLSLWFLRLSFRLFATSSFSLSPNTFLFLFLLFFPPLSFPPCDVSCVCVCVPVIGLFVWPGVLELVKGPDRVTMDGGAWLPLRIRYLPRWHHTGSYQLYPGEETSRALNDSLSS